MVRIASVIFLSENPELEKIFYNYWTRRNQSINMIQIISFIMAKQRP